MILCFECWKNWEDGQLASMVDIKEGILVVLGTSLCSNHARIMRNKALTSMTQHPESLSYWRSEKFA